MNKRELQALIAAGVFSSAMLAGSVYADEAKPSAAGAVKAEAVKVQKATTDAAKEVKTEASQATTNAVEAVKEGVSGSAQNAVTTGQAEGTKTATDAAAPVKAGTANAMEKGKGKKMGLKKKATAVQSSTEQTVDKVKAHACAGHNECKGKGGCKTGDNGCKGKNSCKGKGGCG